jgi:PD-(D/E)XK nuclease superfamily protein
MSPLASVCLGCACLIPPQRLKRHAKYCNNACRRQFVLQEQQNSRLYVLSNKGITGAIAELTVCADLLGRGYEVFRAVSQSASCDLIIMRHGQMQRVEVKMGTIHPRTGRLSYAGDQIRADIVAVLSKAGITYLPSLTEDKVASQPV